MAAVTWKKLTATDVTSRLSVPRAWWKLINPLSDRREVWLRTLDGTGMFWEFRCVPRRTGLYMKPVFQSSEWLSFVSYKRLRVGDMISLQTGQSEFRGSSFVLRARRLAADGSCWIEI